MFARIALLSIAFGTAMAPVTALAYYDKPHQIIYSKQMLKMSIADYQRTQEQLSKDQDRYDQELTRQKNEQISYERLLQKEEYDQNRIDIAKTFKEKNQAKIDRDNLRSILEKTRLWLAAHEQLVTKTTIIIQNDRERIVHLESTIERLNQVLINDGEKPITVARNQSKK